MSCTWRRAAVVGLAMTLVSACSREPARPAGGEAAREGAAGTGEAAAPAGASCVPLPNYTVLQVGPTPVTDAKKVADNCWWQMPVPPVRGNVDEWLGWQLCNACGADVEFELKNLPAFALARCSLFVDASDSAHETVAAGDIGSVTCDGIAEVRSHQYVAGARGAGSTGVFVPSDPEIEIDPRRGGRGAQVRFASAEGVTWCLSEGQTRLSVRGQFQRVSERSRVVFVQGGRLLGAEWSFDLLEFSPPGEAPLPEPRRDSLSTGVTLPPHVTSVVVRDGGGARRLEINTLKPCS